MQKQNAQNAFEEKFKEIELKYNEADKIWVGHLKALGIKAAHPNDGWINRKEKYIQFCYPQFFDNPKVNDLVCLGWSSGLFTIVRIIKIKKSIIGNLDRYYYQCHKI